LGDQLKPNPKRIFFVKGFLTRIARDANRCPAFFFDQNGSGLDRYTNNYFAIISPEQQKNLTLGAFSDKPNPIQQSLASVTFWLGLFLALFVFRQMLKVYINIV
jgi:hypothetical protein